MSKTNTTEHLTGKGKIMFLAVARSFTDQKTGKKEYSVKLELSSKDPAVKHMKKIAEYKIDTKTNRALKGTDKTIVSFKTQFTPAVIDENGDRLEGEEIPFFDSRVDTGDAIVSYKVIDFGEKQIVRLAGVRLMNLSLTEKEEVSSLADTVELLKNI